VYAFDDAKPLRATDALMPRWYRRGNEGYWLVASDGEVFAFDTPFRGSMGGARLNRAVVDTARYGNGELMVGSVGGVFAVSNAACAGSLGATPPSRPIVSMATSS
jgi:hypothetical protein